MQRNRSRASNKPIRGGEAVRIADLMPGFGTAPRHANRPREALDASPHPNGSSPLGPLGLPTKWDGLGGLVLAYMGFSGTPPAGAPGGAVFGGETEQEGGQQGSAHGHPGP